MKIEAASHNEDTAHSGVKKYSYKKFFNSSFCIFTF
jgi:hypothetical protein